METVAQPPADAELHLLTNWGDPEGGKRGRRAAVLSVLIHAAVIGLLVVVPKDFLFSERPPLETAEVKRIVTPLIEPLTELTQKPPNKGKVNKEFNATELKPRPRIQLPQAPPSTTRPRAAEPPPPAPVQAKPVPLPEPPKIEAAVKEPPRPELPPAPLTNPAPPQIQTGEKAKPLFENVGAPPPVSTGRGQVPVPNPMEAIRGSGRGTGSGGMMVGDPGASGPGGYGSGINLPPSPGSQGSNLQLLSDPMGVDFRPYLAGILSTVKRNWFAIMPESVRLGRRGRVSIQFSIARDGRVPKLVIASGSGADALDRAAVAAISASNPFPPLPGEFKGDRVVLQFNFAYNIPRQ